MRLKPEPKKPVQRRNIPHCEDILNSAYEAAISWNDLKTKVATIAKKQGDDDRVIILSLEVEDYGDSTYLKIRWVENESDSAFAKRMADYEAKVVEYKLWKKEHAKAIKAEEKLRAESRRKEIIATKERELRHAKEAARRAAALELEIAKLKKS